MACVIPPACLGLTGKSGAGQGSARSHFWGILLGPKGTQSQALEAHSHPCPLPSSWDPCRGSWVQGRGGRWSRVPGQLRCPPEPRPGGEQRPPVSTPQGPCHEVGVGQREETPTQWAAEGALTIT